MFRGALKLNEFCAWAGIGRTTAYEEIGSGRLTIVKVGRRSLIRISDAENWLSELKALSKPREWGANSGGPEMNEFSPIDAEAPRNEKPGSDDRVDRVAPFLKAKTSRAIRR
jgi:hypothetical protein